MAAMFELTISVSVCKSIKAIKRSYNAFAELYQTVGYKPLKMWNIVLNS